MNKKTENSKFSQRILIVEDDSVLRNVLVDKLSLEGFSCLEAKNGKDGLDIALDKHPDLILLDIIMPKMDGITMLKKLREDTWGKTVTVLILTNLSEPKDISDSVTENITGYLIKSDWKLQDVVYEIKKHFV